MIKTQFTLYLDNQPGALYAVTSMLAEAHINIEGISVASSEESGLAQFVTSDRDATHDMLKEANIAFSSDGTVANEDASWGAVKSLYK